MDYQHLKALYIDLLLSRGYSMQELSQMSLPKMREESEW